MKKISVVTPCYNREKFVKQCIDSVKGSITLNEFEFEHVVIDDGSTDNSRQVIDTINYPHLKKIYLETNLGQSAAKNRAIASLDTDYVFILDSDDLITQSALRYLLKKGSETQAEWIYGDALTIDENLQYLPEQDYYGWQFKTPQQILTSMLSGQHVFLSTVMFTPHSFQVCGKYDESLRRHETQDLFLRFALNNYLPQHTPSTVILRRVHNQNTSLDTIRNPKNFIQGLKILYQKYYQHLEKSLEPSQLNIIKESLALK